MASGYIHIKPTTVVTAIKTIFTVRWHTICVYRRPLRRCGIARNTLCSGVCLWRWPEAIIGITKFERFWTCRTQCPASYITWPVIVFFFSTKHLTFGLGLPSLSFSTLSLFIVWLCEPNASPANWRARLWFCGVLPAVG